MEDIRDNRTKKKEDGLKDSSVDNWTRINAVFLKIYMRLGFIIKSYKWVWLLILTSLILKFPSQIGEFIGSWVNDFLENFLENIK
jgi:hypothetical protein